jgi:hypothetical protein
VHFVSIFSCLCIWIVKRWHIRHDRCVIEHVTLQSCTLEVLGSNLGRDNTYSDSFCDIPQNLHANSGILHEIDHDLFIPKLSIPFMYYPVIRRRIVWALTYSQNELQKYHRAYVIMRRNSRIWKNVYFVPSTEEVTFCIGCSNVQSSFFLECRNFSTIM